MSLDGCKSKALVLKAIEGDQSSITELYYLTYPTVRTVAINIVKSEADADDIVQNSYIKAFSNLEQLREPEKFEAWLYKIVANKCKDYLRKKKPLLFSSHDEDDDTSMEEIIEDETRDYNPEDVLLSSDTRKQIYDLLESLPDEQRICLIYYAVNGMKISEIADLLDVPEATVKSRLKYAKSKMQVKIKDLENKGVKIRGVSGIALLPLLRFLFTTEQVRIPPMSGNIAGSISSASKVSQTSKTVGAVTEKAAKGTFAKFVGSTAFKIVAGVLAATITFSAVFYHFSNEKSKNNISDSINNSGTADESTTVPEIYFENNALYFGSYPQTLEEDENILSVLRKIPAEWKSYEYYCGTGSWIDGKMSPSDFMKYFDIDLNSDGKNDYRAVTFSSYRPSSTDSYKTNDSPFLQQKNGYYINKIYYFKYEPIKWRILDVDEGLVMSNSVIDSQLFNNYAFMSSDGNYEYYGNPQKTYYASDYGNSSIRQWLNNDFYFTAFSEYQQSLISKNLTIDATDLHHEKDNGLTTYDNSVFLLSHADVTNTEYGFLTGFEENDKAKQLEPTDYAQCQGSNHYYYDDNYTYIRSFAPWWTRTSIGSCYVTTVAMWGGFVRHGSFAHETCNGVVPALKISDLKSLMESNPQ